MSLNQIIDAAIDEIVEDEAAKRVQAKLTVHEICSVILPTVYDTLGEAAFIKAGRELWTMLRDAHEAAGDFAPTNTDDGDGELQTKALPLAKREYD